MTFVSNARALSLAAVIAFSAVGAARGQFYAMGTAPLTDQSQVSALSADGTKATGFSYSQNRYPIPGFVWSASGGRTDFGLDAGIPVHTLTHAMSSDGGTIAGSERVSGGSLRPFIYSGPGTFRTLGTIGSYSDSEAFGISGDGSVVAGGARTANFLGSRAFRWTDAGGMQSLGYTRPSHFYSTATGISRDGQSIVGYSNDGTTQDAFVWTQDHGMQGLRGINGLNARAYGVNATGTVIVGASEVNINGGNRAVVWLNGSLVDLGPPPNTGPSFALASNDDGSIIVGNCTIASTFENRAMIWTAALGSQLLGNYLLAQGVSVPANWTFYEAFAVSADGRTIGGRGGFGSDPAQGFVVTIPSPSGVLVLCCAILTTRRRRV